MALVLLGLAAGAMGAARRWATAAGLAVVAALMLPVLSGVLADERLEEGEIERSIAANARIQYSRPYDDYRVSIAQAYVNGVLVDRIYVDGVFVSEFVHLPLPTTGGYRPELSAAVESRAIRYPAILRPPESPLVPGDPPSTATGFWSPESEWRTPAWICMAFLLALTALGTTIAELGTDQDGL